MQEIFECDNGLISKQSWVSRIDQLRKETIPATELELKESIARALEDRIPDASCGLLLSGGVDSSLIALLLKTHHADVRCYTVGVDGSQDIVMAREVASLLGLQHKERILSPSELHVLLKKTKTLFQEDIFPNNPNPAVLLGVAAVELAALELAKDDHINLFFGGLGAEEIFAGYNRHLKSDNINDECWRGLRDVVYDRDLRRDAKVAVHYGIRFATPFLDADLIRCAMGIPAGLKIDDEHKKVILRRIAHDLGLPHHVAYRKKKAAQYGSAFMKSIERLAKDNGFRYTRDFFDAL
ncbi:asparagine synthase C-terminal domain-containing protein [Candidatus Woesearchaeota archaeon]|nr:asparagine synthase C-terminal domain-containing protein [Candidatus Woesearchaeota archaeon]